MQDTYKVVEHFPHEVNQDGVVLPLLDVVLEEHLLLLLPQIWEYHLLHMLYECILEVTIKICCLV